MNSNPIREFASRVYRTFSWIVDKGYQSNYKTFYQEQINICHDEGHLLRGLFWSALELTVRRSKPGIPSLR